MNFGDFNLNKAVEKVVINKLKKAARKVLNDEEFSKATFTFDIKDNSATISGITADQKEKIRSLINE